jgi:hypothetical protein
MSTLAYSLPRAATGGPRFSRDRVEAIAEDAWTRFTEILGRACPMITVPSPVRKALADTAAGTP